MSAPWLYSIIDGALAHFGTLVAKGYSGALGFKNDPPSVNLESLGPIPPGAWYIGAESDDKTHGPVSMHLIPLSGTETYRRGGFMIHGDSATHPGAASCGCIVLDHATRELIANSRDRQLIVLPSFTLVTA